MGKEALADALELHNVVMDGGSGSTCSVVMMEDPGARAVW